GEQRVECGAGQRRHARRDRPFGAEIVLRLDGAEPAHHLDGVSESLSGEVLAGEAGAGDPVAVARIRRPAHGRFRHQAAAGSASGRTGRRTVTTVPLPCWELMATVPPWRSTKLLTIDRPRPAPPRAEPLARLSKRSNT